MTTKQTVISLILIFVIFFIGGFIGWNLKSRQNFSPTVSEVYNLIQSKYYRDIHETEAIKGLITSLNDPYSYYLDSETYNRIKEENSGNFKGIGILYSFENKTLRITEVFPGSPAEEVGLKSSYEIITIDGKPVSEMENIFEVSKLLRGNAEGSVKLNEITINKGSFFIPGVTFKEIENDIGYLKIYRFDSNIEDSLKAINTGKLIIDLRNNTGGNTQNSLDFADQFISEGVISKEKLWDEGIKENRAVSGGLLEDIQILVLVNRETSSAAETVAAALKDNNRAKIIGETTYGKGIVGSTFELSDKSAIHLSVGEWFRSNGESVDDTGVKPDIEVEDKDDLILQKAVEILR